MNPVMLDMFRISEWPDSRSGILAKVASDDAISIFGKDALEAPMSRLLGSASCFNYASKLPMSIDWKVALDAPRS